MPSRRFVLETSRRLLGGAYYRLGRSGWVKRCWHPSFLKVRLRTEDGPLVKYVHHGRTVAQYWPEDNR